VPISGTYIVVLVFSIHSSIMMARCDNCQTEFKTKQGLSGHRRFCHPAPEEVEAPSGRRGASTRRSYSEEFRAAVALEWLSSNETQEEVASRNLISRSLISKWAK